MLHLRTGEHETMKLNTDDLVMLEQIVVMPCKMERKGEYIFL